MWECEANLFGDGSLGNGVAAILSNNLNNIVISFDSTFAFENDPLTPCVS